MKRNRFNKIVVVLAMAIVLSACSDELAELNKNPNAYESVNAKFLFTRALLTQANLNPNGNRFNNMQMLQQEATYSEVTAPGDKYFAEGYVRNNWSAYTGCLKDINLVIDEASKDPANVNLRSVARIWRVYIYHQLTDLYGDIPYSEANKGLSGSYTPKYDIQADIYKNMITELDESAKALDPAKPTYGSSDLIYSGDPTSWKQFAYSLMLRIGMRLSKIDMAESTRVVKLAIAGGPITTAAALAKIPYADGALTRNPLSDQARILDYVDGQNPLNVQGSKMSKRLIDHLKGNSTTTKDPRLNVMSILWVKQADKTYKADTATALQKGMQNAQFNGYPADFETYSEPNVDVVYSYSAPFVVIGPAEVNFLLAEAVVLGMHTGDATAYYNEGVKAAMAQWALFGAGGAISSDKVNTYLAYNPFKSAGTVNDKVEQISTQKWVLFYLDQIENFSNWRRTGYPVLIPTNYPGNITGGRIPRRYIVPESEETLNKINFLAAKARQSGENTLLSRVWWDKP